MTHSSYRLFEQRGVDLLMFSQISAATNPELGSSQTTQSTSYAHNNNINDTYKTATMMNNSSIDFASFVQAEGNLAMERLLTSTSKVVPRRKSAPGKSLKKGMKPLPADFEVSKYSVLCGRGKGCYNACGNRRLRVIVSTFLQQYVDAQNSPHEKSQVIEKVVKMVKEACPVGAFIKYENGSYYELSHKASKEKVAALFRDFWISTYKEKETKSKQVKRKQRPSLATSAPSMKLPSKQTLQPPQQSLHQFQVRLFQQQHSQRQQQSQEDEQFPVFGHVTPLETPFQRGVSGDASVTSQDSSSTGSFYDVDTNRPVPFPTFESDEVAFIGIDSLMG